VVVTLLRLRSRSRWIDDKDQFRRFEKGDQVIATFTQAIAMVVEPKK
jgi:hypothetical protein